MNPIHKTIASIKTAIKKETTPRYILGTIVSESKYPSYSVVQLDGGAEIEVLNTRYATMVGKKVRIGYEPAMPATLQVLGLYSPLMQSFYNLFIANHHKNHEFPGHDTVYVHGAQFLPLNFSTDGFVITVYGEVLRGDGTWISATTTPLDIEASIPAPGARYVLIEVEVDGTIVATEGTTQLDKYLLTNADIPEPTDLRHSICAIALYDGQSKINRDVRQGVPNDVIDLRWSNWNRNNAASGASIANAIHSATASAITDDDEMGFWESVANGLRKITWANIKATLKTYFDTLYAVVAHTHTHNSTTSIQGGAGGEYYHLSTAQHTGLLGGSETSLHTHPLSTHGWTERSSETWVRTGNYTFTISGDVTATYRKGTKIRYKQGGAYEYGVVGSSSYSAPNTTVTLIANDDYAMVDAVITNHAVSFIENPEGFPNSFNFAATTSITSSAGSLANITVSVAKFVVANDEMKFWFDVTFDLTTATALSILASLPITPSITSAFAAGCRDASSGVIPVGIGTSGAANGTTWRLASGSNWSVGTTKRFYGSGSTLF